MVSHASPNDDSEQAPPYSYVAYIDEAGDDGLKAVKPLVPNGASEWLILSAVVIAAERQSEVSGWIDAMTAQIKNHQASGLHFRNLNPANKAMVCKSMAGLRARYFVVASNKKNMQGYQNPYAAQIPSENWFYCWLTRVLLERVTRFALRRSMLDHGEPRKMRIEFSARGGLKYSQMSAYYEWLHSKGRRPFLPWGTLEWAVMHPRLLYVYPHLEREGLQLADAVASSFFKACDKHDTGSCEPRFAEMLRPRMARAENGAISGYGVKLLPGLKKGKLEKDQAAIFRAYGYPQQWWDPEAFS
jgi:hypothetical protein